MFSSGSQLKYRIIVCSKISGEEIYRCSDRFSAYQVLVAGDDEGCVWIYKMKTIDKPANNTDEIQTYKHSQVS
jgi:hypothetical protein